MCTYNYLSMSANSTTFFLSAALLALILYSAYDINNHLERVGQVMDSKVTPTIKSPYKDQQDSCSDYQERSKKCLEEAQACIKVLNSYNEKNKAFDGQVKECQDRNAKNSKRNTELKDELDYIQKRMKEIQEREL